MSYKLSIKKGFTLLELLIVISIIAVLSLILIFALNPAEILRKARDTQRISDLNTLKTALSVYVTSTSTPILGATTPLGGTGYNNIACKSGTGAGTWTASQDKIWYSVLSNSAISGVVDAGVSLLATSTTSAGNTDGTGWIPINLETLTAGSPISKFPVDPTNSIANMAGPVNSDLVYRYACNATSTTFEIDAALESNEYTVTNDLRAKDGGDNPNLYEEGTNLKIMGSSNTF